MNLFVCNGEMGRVWNKHKAFCIYKFKYSQRQFLCARATWEITQKAHKLIYRLLSLREWTHMHIYIYEQREKGEVRGYQWKISTSSYLSVCILHKTEVNVRSFLKPFQFLGNNLKQSSLVQPKQWQRESSYQLEKWSEKMANSVTRTEWRRTIGQ